MSRPRPSAAASGTTQALRGLMLLLLCFIALQLYFAGRVAWMRLVDPGSSAMQRSEMWRMATTRGWVAWAHEWVPSQRIGEPLKRAVIASEDAGFVDHAGFAWSAMERAWQRSQRAQSSGASAAGQASKTVGGSTITQQLAKNLFLSGERTVLRKGQELLITMALEALLPKERILEIYLNSVEWGEGLFGAQMAARYYHRVDASQLSTQQAARLAVMLPAPKRFELNPNSHYVQARSAAIAARMGLVELP